MCYCRIFRAVSSIDGCIAIVYVDSRPRVNASASEANTLIQISTKLLCRYNIIIDFFEYDSLPTPSALVIAAQLCVPGPRSPIRLNTLPRRVGMRPGASSSSRSPRRVRFLHCAN